MIRYILCYCLIAHLSLGKVNIPGKNVCRKTSLELTNNNGDKIDISAEKLSVTSNICKMKNLTINFSDGYFKAEYGEIDPKLLSGYVSQNVYFKNKLISSNFDKIFIDLSNKQFYTTDKVESKIKNIDIYSEGIKYEKTKSKITFLKNVKVRIN